METKHNLNGKFTDFDHYLKILLHATAGENLKSILYVVKKKMYFCNWFWHDIEKKRRFVDDCGTWDRPSLENHFYLATNTRTFEYNITKKPNLIIQRTEGYLSLPRSSPRCKCCCYSFEILFTTQRKHLQRRVSRFQIVPKRSDRHILCLLEYIGSYQGEQIHGK